MGHYQIICTYLLFRFKRSTLIKFNANKMFLYTIQCIFFNLIYEFVYIIDITDLYLIKGPSIHIVDCYFSKPSLFFFGIRFKNDDFDIFT